LTRVVRRTNRFKKDVRRQINRGKDFREFKEVINKIVAGIPLPSKYHDHKLLGDYSKYKNVRECHLEPDWLLIYLRIKNEVIFVRTGTHADLFG
jgi:mRNA interferase YafQ